MRRVIWWRKASSRFREMNKKYLPNREFPNANASLTIRGHNPSSVILVESRIVERRLFGESW